jgi:hypothetical protein
MPNWITTTGGSSYMYSLQSAPSNQLLRIVGDGTSFLADREAYSDYGGTHQEFEFRQIGVAASGTVAVLIGFTYIDASWTKCPLLSAHITVTTTSRNSSALLGVKQDFFDIGAGFQVIGGNYVIATSSKQSPNSDGTVSVNNVSVDSLTDGQTVAGPIWAPVVVTFENVGAGLADLMFVIKTSTAW